MRPCLIIRGAAFAVRLSEFDIHQECHIPSNHGQLVYSMQFVHEFIHAVRS